MGSSFPDQGLNRNPWQVNVQSPNHWDPREVPCGVFFFLLLSSEEIFPGGSAVENLPAKSEDASFGLWVGKIPWRRKWQPTPVFLSAESHGQRSLVGYSPWDRKESDTIEQT